MKIKSDVIKILFNRLIYLMKNVNYLINKRESFKKIT